MPTAPAPAVPVNQQPEVDPAVWREVSPVEATIPAVGSRVFYFPQGHSEQASSPPEFSGVALSRPYFLCRTAAVRHLADTETEEALVRISLVPVDSPSEEGAAATSPPPEHDGREAATSYAKILTLSDANNGGGFSVPRRCAETVFPPLGLEVDMPVQVLVVSDLLGNQWSFRHVYRGNPRRHLLTTGWSKFVNAKKLVAGDSVVFVRNGHGKIFVGIQGRRRRRSSHLGSAVAAEVSAGSGFVRDGRGRVSPRAVVEAVRGAEEGRAFEVEFYPGKGKPEFVVAEGTVLSALTMSAADLSVYAPGTKVRAPCKSVHPGVVAWYNGTIASAAYRYGGPWSVSPWRMLEITWHDSEDLSHLTYVSPWQVEICTVESFLSPLTTTEEEEEEGKVSSSRVLGNHRDMHTEALYDSSTNNDVVVASNSGSPSTRSHDSTPQLDQDPNPVRLFGADIQDPSPMRLFGVGIQDPSPVRLFGVDIAPTTPTSSSRGSTEQE